MIFLRLKGPFGTLFLDQVNDKNLVFLATGTGIAPVKAILEGLSERRKSERPKSVKVYWGGRNPSDLYLQFPEVDYLFSYEKIISKSSSGWLGAVDYVQNVFLNTNPDLDDVTVYACGSESMIRDSRDLLIKRGLSEDSFFSDAFVPSGP
jgi:CDP-4-dehydro-6-deoxyglucose reductase, E3